MSEKEVQYRVLNTYSRNMKYLETNENTLYKKLKLFEKAIELEEIKERYILELRDQKYFDIYDSEYECWMYEEDSYKYSKDRLKDINYEIDKNTFKTYYEVLYENEVAEKAKTVSIKDSHVVFGNAPISDYINIHSENKKTLKDIYLMIILGVGLGIHIPYIHEKIKARQYYIIEPALEIFRLSLFVTDYEYLSKLTELKFAVSLSDYDFFKTTHFFNMETLYYNSYIKFFLFSKNMDQYINIIQDVLVSQKHLVYSYNRELLSLSRTYEYAKDEYSFFKVSVVSFYQLFQINPTLILAAGPSLQKNIDFIKENKNKFIIVAVYGTMPILEKNNIKPDFIVQYDEGGELVLSTIEKIKDLSFFDDTVFLFSSHVDKRLSQKIKKENIFMFQAMHEAKKGYGRLTAPQVGELTFSLINIFGGNNLYLLGIDMALDPETGKSHYDGYKSGEAIGHAQKVSNEKYGMRKNIIQVKGNFRKKVNTVPLYKASITHMLHEIKDYKIINKANYYNLSDGAYLDGVEPLKIEDLEISTFNDINKTIEVNNFKKELKNNCSCTIEEDEEFRKVKLNDALILEKTYDELYNKQKYITPHELRILLLTMQEELLKKMESKDLQDIIYNFASHNIPPIFHFLNLKGISNYKKHQKKLLKIYYSQVKKIIKEYKEIIQIDNKKA